MAQIIKVQDGRIVWQGALPDNVINLNINGGLVVNGTSDLKFEPVGNLYLTPSGSVLLRADPIVPLGAVTKQYADNLSNYSAGTGISISSHVISNTGVTSFNTRTSSVTLTSLDVTDALGYIPSSGGSGTVTSIGIEVPPFLAVSPSTITSSGIFVISLPTGDGTIPLPGENGGTGAVNFHKAITLGGNLTTSGAFDITLTSTNTTSITLPTTGTLATLNGLEILTNKTLTTPVINGLPTGTGVDTLNTASTLVARDASGNFSAGTITASLIGSATQLGGALAADYALLASPTFTGLPLSTTAAIGTDTTQIATTAFVNANIRSSIPVACSDETTALTTGIKVTFRMPYAFTLTAIKGSLTTAQTSGTIFTVDVKKAGVSLFSTLLTIDNMATTTATATIPSVLSTTALADDDEITIEITQVGDGTATGLKIYLIGRLV